MRINGIWRGEREDGNMVLMHVGFLTSNMQDFLPENIRKHLKYKDEIRKTERDMKKRGEMWEDNTRACRISHPKRVGSSTQKHLKYINEIWRRKMDEIWRRNEKRDG